MLQRVFTWLLVTAMAAAPVAPAWAMARQAPAPVDATQADATQVAHAQVPHHSAASVRAAGNPTNVHVHSESLARQTADGYRIANSATAAHSPHASTISSSHATHAAHGTGESGAHSTDNAQGVSAAGQSPVDCGDGRCDGQCCGVCILTLGTCMPRIATTIFGASDSPSYLVQTYVSFVPTLLGRPPQS